ncbi:MAG: hypothetical protein ACU84J_03845 [Gammaproteobacteria bacterium]
MTAERAARESLISAMHYAEEQEPEKCFGALENSLALKSNPTAKLFKAFFIEQQCRQLLALLAENRIKEAKHRLYQIRRGIPYSETLRHILAFVNYLQTYKAIGPKPKLDIKGYALDTLHQLEHYADTLYTKSTDTIHQYRHESHLSDNLDNSAPQRPNDADAP